ncbi:5'-nucleotidase [Lentzea guizhouensis]|uniref:5'-nucleotidase n=1 Tax=Lentzea guizhouensis TaxID=1586287 RepID=A0A1B2HUL3_9PSEU|nr:5'-nucleotidase [Lentzea guizhouensis]ANZ41393.1 5'-nucleotidase [Lentzea guizhouensis]
MAPSLENLLVVGVASSALFDLTESDAVFQSSGVEAYRTFQEARLDEPFQPGVAFPFIRRLLGLNALGPLVEVIVLSRNSPETGLRILRSAAHHGLSMTRAIFTEGRAPHEFMHALHMSLFLSANESDVLRATAGGLPAGQVLKSSFRDDDDPALRIAFDFDGVLADDAAERVYQASGLDSFQEHEVSNVVTPLDPGPLRDFLAGINRIQRVALDRVRVSVVTARSAPAHERAINSLKAWGLTVNDAFFLGGLKKGPILDVLKPHIFFDDQRGHLVETVPCVHVPFGVSNE